MKQILLLILAYAAPVPQEPLPILQKAQQQLRDAQSLSAVCTYTLEDKARSIRQTARIWLKRPNLARVETDLDVSGKVTHNWRIFAADGQTSWRVYADTKEVSRWPSSADGSDVNLGFADLVKGFYGQASNVAEKIDLLQKEGLLREMRFTGPQTRKGSRCQVVRLVYQRVGTQEVLTEDHFIDAQSIERAIRVTSNASPRVVTWSLDRLDLRPPNRSFAYRPPVGYRLAKNDEAPIVGALRSGTLAPDFTVQDAAGKPIRLSDYRGKTVVLDFWATWCDNCIRSFPEKARLAAAIKDVVILAVDVGDAPNVFADWLRKNPGYQPIVFALDPQGIHGKGIDTALYQVGGLPTVYVIAPDGKITASFVGDDGKGNPGIEAAVNADKPR